MTYLIVTPLREFWPNKGPAVLMGPWCLPPFGENQGNDIHQNQMLECPWKTYDEIKKAYFFAQESYKLILPCLAQALNKIHRTSYSERYWQVLIGPWLNWFINIILDRTTRLQLAKDCFVDLKIKGLSASSFITPTDTLNFLTLAKEDFYNLQLITRLAEKINIPTEPLYKKNEKLVLSKGVNKVSLCFKKRFKSKLLHLYHDIHAKLARSFKASIVLYQTYHPKFFLIKLTLLAGGKVIDRINVNEQPTSSISDMVLRDAFEKIISSLSFFNHPFQKIILSLISKEMPTIFLEGFSNLSTFAEHEFGVHYPKIICSANAWFFDEPFKYWSAQSINKGTKLYGLQHGGNYGVSSFLFAQEYEIAITDKYFTWGWDKFESYTSLVSTPSQKLIDIKSCSLNVKNKKKILFVGTAFPRYLVEFPHIPEHFTQYLEWQNFFFTLIEPNIFAKTAVRLHYEDNGWKAKKRLKKLQNQLSFESWNIPFRESLYSSRLFVCDHLSTTFVEALVSNVPTILFWNPKLTFLYHEAEPFFNDFKKVGILHDTPESAANLINKVWENVEAWWNEEERQKVILNFCSNYARTSKTPIRDWLRIFKNINEKN